MPKAVKPVVEKMRSKASSLTLSKACSPNGNGRLSSEAVVENHDR